VVVAEFLSGSQVDHDRPALGRGKEHARHLQARPRDARRIGSRRACSLLFR
jgi:hypothetical protein